MCWPFHSHARKIPIWLSKLSHYTRFMITTPSDASLSMYKWLVLNEFPHTQKKNTVKRAEEILALFSPVGTSGGMNDWKKTLIFNVNRPEWDSKSPRAHGCNLAETYESHMELVSFQRGDQDGEDLAWGFVRLQLYDNDVTANPSGKNPHTQAFFSITQHSKLFKYITSYNTARWYKVIQNPKRSPLIHFCDL